MYPAITMAQDKNTMSTPCQLCINEIGSLGADIREDRKLILPTKHSERKNKGLYPNNIIYKPLVNSANVNQSSVRLLKYE
jgi:hypothetical protein